MSKYVHLGWIGIILRAFSEILREQMNLAGLNFVAWKHTLETISIGNGSLSWKHTNEIGNKNWEWNIGNTEMSLEMEKVIVMLVPW